MILLTSRYRRVEKLAYAPDGRRLFGAAEADDRDGRKFGIVWWNPGDPDGEAVGIQNGRFGLHFADFCALPDGRFVYGKPLVSHSYQRVYTAHDPEDGSEIGLPVSGSFSDIRLVACAASGRLIVGTAWNVARYHSFRLPLASAPQPEWTCEMPSRAAYPFSKCPAIISSVGGEHFTAIEYARRGKQLVAQRRSQVDGTPVGAGLPVPASAHRLGLAAGDTRLVVAASASLFVHDLTKPKAKPVKVTTANRQHFTDIAVHPDGRRVLATCNDETVREYDAVTLQELRAYAWKVGRLRCVAIAPDGLTAAAGSDTGKVVVWDLE